MILTPELLQSRLDAWYAHHAIGPASGWIQCRCGAWFRNDALFKRHLGRTRRSGQTHGKRP